MMVIAVEGNIQSTAAGAESMDVIVHRIRHLDWMPRGISRLAAHENLLCIAREDGSVELQDANQKYRTLALIPGLKTREVDCLTFVDDATTTTSFPKAFGASRDGTLFECDWTRLSHSRVTNAGGGAIFCAERIAGTSMIAVGCEDNTVRFFDTSCTSAGGDEMLLQSDKSTLRLVNTLTIGGGAPVLSISYSVVQKLMAVGLADGTIRLLECISSKNSLRWKNDDIRMTVGTYGRKQATNVWSILMLDDGTCVSGDSLGEVRFFDCEVGTEVFRCQQNSVKADVLALTVNQSQTKVFASGVDSRVISIERSEARQSSRWIQRTVHRPHTHDVKSLVICKKPLQESKQDQEAGGGSKTDEVLCSGGADTKICTYVVSEFKGYRPKKLFPWPSSSPVSVSKGGRILCLTRSNSIDFYRIRQRNDIAKVFKSAPGEAVGQSEDYLGTLSLDGDRNLYCSSISNDGNFFAVSNGLSTYLFSLHFGEDGEFKYKTVEVPDSLQIPASCLTFFENSLSLAIASLSGSIFVLDVSDDGVDLVHEFEVSNSSKTNDERNNVFPFSQLAVSSDEEWIAGSRGSSHGNKVEVFSLSRRSHTWTIPSLDADHTTIRFLPTFKDGSKKASSSAKSALVIACWNGSFYVFDVAEKRLSKWSEKLGVPASKNLPLAMTVGQYYPTSLAMNPATSSKFLMGSYGSFSVIDFDLPIPNTVGYFPMSVNINSRMGKINKKSDTFLSRKRKLSQAGDGAEADNKNFFMCFRYNSMLFLDFIDENEMIVVEQPWMSIFNALPNALPTNKFQQ